MGIHQGRLQMKIKNLYLGSLTSIAVLASSLANAEQAVTVPTFEGGFTASIGTFYVVPSSADGTLAVVGPQDNPVVFDNLGYISPSTKYQFGWEASIGYIFEDTGNDIELYYRGLSNDTTNDINGVVSPIFEDTTSDISSKLKYELETADLMIGQFIDLGTHVQMRFSGGLSYLFTQQQENLSADVSAPFPPSPPTPPLPGPPAPGIYAIDQTSKFSGFGPRVSLDSRYDFGGDAEGLGIVGGASLAFFLGNNKITGNTDVAMPVPPPPDSNLRDPTIEQIETTFSDKLENQAVTNLRANLGIDYVFFFDNEESTLGIELGYLVDYYDNAIATVDTAQLNGGPAGFDAGIGFETNTSALTFSGPYLQIKGVF